MLAPPTPPEGVGSVPRIRNGQHWCTGRYTLSIPCPDGTAGCSRRHGRYTEHTCSVDAAGSGTWTSEYTGSQTCSAPNFLGVPTKNLDWDVVGVGGSGRKCILTPQRRVYEAHAACDRSRLWATSPLPGRRVDMALCIAAGCRDGYPQVACGGYRPPPFPD